MKRPMPTMRSLPRGMLAALLWTGLALAAGQAAAAPPRAGTVQVTRAWVRALPPNAPVAGGFAAIGNVGDSADILLGASSDEAARVELHEVRHEAGVMRMRPLADGLPIPAGASVELKPGGYHLMFIAPVRAFAAGERVHATLHFQHAGAIDVVFEVRTVAGKVADKPRQ